MEHYSAIKSNNTAHYKTQQRDDSLKHYAELKNPYTKESILENSVDLKFQIRQN